MCAWASRPGDGGAVLYGCLRSGSHGPGELPQPEQDVGTGAEAGGGRRQRQPGGPEQQVLEVEEGGQQDSRGPGGAQLPGEGRAGEQGLRQTGQIGEQLKVGVHPDQSGQKGERAGDMRGEAGENC